MPRRNNQPIDHTAALRAIYLDFEGPGRGLAQTEGPPPMFAGTLIDGDYTFWVHEPCFETFAQSKGHCFLPLHDFVTKIFAQAEQEEHRIVFWSSHELELFAQQGCSLDTVGFDVIIPARDLYRPLFDEFNENDRRFRNPETSKSEKKRLRSKAFGLMSLVAEHLGLPRPTSYGAGLVGKWIRTMLAQAQTRESFSQWAKSAKSSSTKLINHNKHDCAATRHILLQIL